MPELDSSTTDVKGVIDERQNAQSTYRLIDENEELFLQTGKQIISACKMHIGIQVWSSNFKKTLEIVRQWAKDRGNQIAQVLVELRSDKVIFFVVPRSQQYDFDLGFAQADLDVTLNTQCNIGYTETRQIPEYEKANFISTDAKLVYPHG